MSRFTDCDLCNAKVHTNRFDKQGWKEIQVNTEDRWYCLTLCPECVEQKSMLHNQENDTEATA